LEASVTTLDYRPEAFVRERLNEREKDARALLDENRQARQRGLSSTLWDEQDAEANAALIDIESKRRILDIIQPDLDTGTQVFAPKREGFERWGKAYLIACALALPWPDHPDYSPKWAKEAEEPSPERRCYRRDCVQHDYEKNTCTLSMGAMHAAIASVYPEWYGGRP
jgi:hypothetical protein